MSRYHLESSVYADIVVGWDAPLGTYFVQVWNSKDDDEPVLWLGTDLHELASVDALQVALADYCSVPLTVQEQLLNDKNNDPFTLDRPGLGFLNP